MQLLQSLSACVFLHMQNAGFLKTWLNNSFFDKVTTDNFSSLNYSFKVFGHTLLFSMSCVMRKTDFCLSENKGVDQQCSYCTAD